MTIIEFFDKSALENLSGALVCEPDRVVYIGDSHRVMEKAICAYQKVLDGRGLKILLEHRSVNRNDLQHVVSVLEEIVEEYGDCVFDLTGGDDMYLVAVGMLMERHLGEVQCHRFNYNKNAVIDCDSDGKNCRSKSFNITVEENVTMHGGEIIRDHVKPELITYEWDFSEDFCKDIENMWSICRINARNWNLQMDTLRDLCETFRTGSSLFFQVDRSTASDAFERVHLNLYLNPAILNGLQEMGLLRKLELRGVLRFEFKNDQIKRCLTTAGQVLELIIAKRMRELTEPKSKTPLYHEVKVGICLDWDAPESKDEFRTVNEIDVFAMKGSIPIIISCKNGEFDMQELYKLNTVADRFGGKYVKKILVTSELDRMGGRADYIRARAGDMGIEVLEDVDRYDDKEFTKKLKNLS